MSVGLNLQAWGEKGDCTYTEESCPSLCSFSFPSSFQHFLIDPATGRSKRKWTYRPPAAVLPMYAPAPMYSGLRWRSLERKLRSCLWERQRERGGEVWGGGSGARGARGRAVAAKGEASRPFSKNARHWRGLKIMAALGEIGKKDIWPHMFSLCCSLRWNLVTSSWQDIHTRSCQLEFYKILRLPLFSGLHWFHWFFIDW